MLICVAKDVVVIFRPFSRRAEEAHKSPTARKKSHNTTIYWYDFYYHFGVPKVRAYKSLVRITVCSGPNRLLCKNE